MLSFCFVIYKSRNYLSLIDLIISEEVLNKIYKSRNYLSLIDSAGVDQDPHIYKSRNYLSLIDVFLLS